MKHLLKEKVVFLLIIIQIKLIKALYPMCIVFIAEPILNKKIHSDATVKPYTVTQLHGTPTARKKCILAFRSNQGLMPCNTLELAPSQRLMHNLSIRSELNNFLSQFFGAYS